MKLKSLMNITKPKIYSIIVTFFIIFFVNIPAMFNSCNWNPCPDFIGDDIISIHPNFYIGEKCGGITGQCYPPHWNLRMFYFDIVLWIIVNLVIFYFIERKIKS